MLETVANQALVGFFIACLAAIPFGYLVGWRLGFEAGLAAGCLLVGLAGCASAAWLGWHQWHWTRDSLVTQGVLLSAGDGVDRPRVRFRTDDGAVHELLALGGSLRDRQPGDPVSVRYLPAQPDAALVDDFQGLWGGVWAMTLFGVLPLSFGLFFVHAARAARRPGAGLGGRVVRPGPRRARTAKERAAQARQARTARHLLRAGLVVMVGSLVLGAAWPGLDALPAIGYAFIGVAAGLLLLMQGVRMIKPGSKQDQLIMLILALGFALFGFGAVLLAG
jgi:hypothetical protein